ncbi:MAG: LpxL/LpxP family acyltransferase [Arsenophonus sp. NC-CH8-MAG3]
MIKISSFKISYLHPQYWLTWLGIGFLYLLVLVNLSRWAYRTLLSPTVPFVISIFPVTV